VAANAPITVRFDQPMDQASVEAAFSIEPAVTGELTWPEPETAVFTPAESLAEGQTYNVRVADSASALNGQTLQEPVEFSLQTTGPLAVTQTIPADGSDEVQTDAVITVVFNKPVVPLVSSGEQADLPQPLTFDPPATGAGEWTSTSIYRFIPDPPLAGATTYTVSVDPALVDVTGSALEGAPTWQFTTLRPEVVTVVPENEAVRIAPTTPITVTFNMPMDTASVEAATTVTAGEGAVPVSFEWQEADRVAVLTPEEMLPLETDVNVTVAASAASANGGATMDGDHTSVFNTVPFPAVLSTQPANGEALVDVWQRGFSVEFVSPMNDETIDGQFIITPDPGDDVDYFINEWDEGYGVFVDFEVEPEVEYTVTIPATAADPYGNTLGEDYTFTFTGATPPALASFNLPRDVAQLSTSFPSDVQILYRDVTELEVSLYRTTLDTELLFNPYQLNERAPSGEAIFQTTIPVEATPDELGVATVELAEGGTLPAGLYELRVNAPELNNDTLYWQNRNLLLIVADTNLVIKEMFGEVNVWATDLATGEPAAGRNLTLYMRNGQESGTAVTDENGFARLDYEPTEAYLEGVAVVSNEPGAAGFGMAATYWTGGISPWQLGLTADGSPEQEIYAYIYTDRPIYRPGDTVYYKGIVRETNFGRYLLPELDELEVSINPNFFFGEEDTFSETFTATLDEDGVFHGEFAIPADIPLGTYSFNLSGNLWLSSRPFTVAEYRAPEFQVTVVPEREEALRGEAVNVNVDATYLFGGSAGDLPVNWTIYQAEFAPTFETTPPYAFGDQAQFLYEFSPFGIVGVGPDGAFVSDGSGQTDANGHITIPLPADLLDDLEAGSRQVTVQATIGGL
ncbi:Ig-like domain-containing protein, partial [Promineifilum sp.]|uniref:Ig-like domain-containing alpha-2-macroglobulin family protein n=1 Tax=Promineifilum sp. TaxID=2664178 RepID=UPI0035B08FB6